MPTAEGVVTIVQESRFQLVDAQGVAHLFVLGHRAGAEPEQLPPLQRRQARLRVRYREPRNALCYVARGVTVLG